MFNRVKYDTCATRTDFADQVSIFDHTMDVSRFVHCSPCRHEKGLIGGNAVSSIAGQPNAQNVDLVRGSMVALENDLRGQTRPVTRCPAYDYAPRGGLVTSKELYKPVVHPVIDARRMQDMSSCQMIGYQPVPAPPKAGEQIKCENYTAGAFR
jgi:hypothetical protein